RLGHCMDGYSGEKSTEKNPFHSFVLFRCIPMDKGSGAKLTPLGRLLVQPRSLEFRHDPGVPLFFAKHSSKQLLFPGSAWGFSLVYAFACSVPCQPGVPGARMPSSAPPDVRKPDA
ncbi:MAG: hypothetical protein ABIO21_06235, partial [Pseudomonas sp.]